MHYDLTTLPNGLRIISERMPSSRSVAIGCWVDTGSRDEIGPEAGTSHFLEHLLFKGSDLWNARRIAESFDAVGAHHNAFTSKEYTCYWAKMRDADLPLGTEILAEMIQRPAFRQQEIDSERHVVLEEINMNEDDPTDVAHEEFIRALWSGHPLGPPVLGTRESITNMTRETIHDYWKRRYTPKSLVIAVAGHVDHQTLVDLASDYFGGWQGDLVDRPHDDVEMTSKVAVRKRDTEQAHLVFGGHGLKRSDERRYAHLVLDHVLGGGMSSRLFTEIREKRGLAYAVHSFRLPMSEIGARAIYVGTTPSQAPEVLKLVRHELDKMRSDGLTADELARAKGHVKGSLALSMEESSSRMNRLGRNELTGMEHLSVDEIVAKVDAVERSHILDVAADVCDGPYVLGATGPFDVAELESFVQ
ncbi:MAG: insulinase family protein [Acidimicrobiia bacterium]|nr:insulinase family protein [Acidimicrobiia bacterium]